MVLVPVLVSTHSLSKFNTEPGERCGVGRDPDARRRQDDLHAQVQHDAPVFRGFQILGVSTCFFFFFVAQCGATLGKRETHKSVVLRKQFSTAHRFSCVEPTTFSLTDTGTLKTAHRRK